MEPPLVMPIMDTEEEKNQATFIDRQGDIVSLPNHILVPFARLAGRQDIRRIKRYHITNVYRPNTVPGHSKFTKAALFDIISPDLRYGPLAASAEIISVVNDCLDTFPNLSPTYNIHISHYKIIEAALNRVPAENRSAVTEILSQPKSFILQKRALLLKKGAQRMSLKYYQMLEDLEEIVLGLEKLSTGPATFLESLFKEVRQTIYTQSAGFEQ